MVVKDGESSDGLLPTSMRRVAAKIGSNNEISKIIAKCLDYLIDLGHEKVQPGRGKSHL